MNTFSNKTAHDYRFLTREDVVNILVQKDMELMRKNVELKQKETSLSKRKQSLSKRMPSLSKRMPSWQESPVASLN